MNWSSEWAKVWAYTRRSWIMTRPIGGLASIRLLTEFLSVTSETRAFVLVGVISLSVVFNGKTGTPLLTLNDPNRAEIESLIGLTFGSVVASVGDLGGTETLDIIVGDAQHDVGGNTDQGQMSVFSGDNGDLLLTLNHPAPQANAHFGASAASIGDVNDDTVPDLIVGAPGQDVAGNPGQGQAYIISGDNAELLFTLDNPTP